MQVETNALPTALSNEKSKGKMEEDNNKKGIDETHDYIHADDKVS